MNNMPRYSIDDTIMDDPVRKTSMKIKGVTYFDRQENLKTLYDQHLKKEDKHLTLQKFYVGTTQTFCVVFNGLEIGTIPEEQLNLFYSHHYNYELSNIHIDVFKNEYGRDIYWAKLFVIFTPKQKYRRAIIELVPKDKPKHFPPSIRPAPQVTATTIQHTKTNEDSPKTQIKESVIIFFSIIGAFFSLLIGIASGNFLFYFATAVLIIIAISYVIEIYHSNNPYLQIYPVRDEVTLIDKYRNSSIATQKWVLYLLNNPTKPQKPKNNYTKYSKKEKKFLSAYRNASEETQNKVINALDVQATHA